MNVQRNAYMLCYGIFRICIRYARRNFVSHPCQQHVEVESKQNWIKNMENDAGDTENERKWKECWKSEHLLNERKQKPIIIKFHTFLERRKRLSGTQNRIRKAFDKVWEIRSTLQAPTPRKTDLFQQKWLLLIFFTVFNNNVFWRANLRL